MKISTLHKIAREIHNQRGIVERRTVNQMTEDLEFAAGDDEESAIETCYELK